MPFFSFAEPTRYQILTAVTERICQDKVLPEVRLQVNIFHNLSE